MSLLFYKKYIVKTIFKLTGLRHNALVALASVLLWVILKYYLLYCIPYPIISNTNQKYNYRLLCLLKN